MAKRKRKSPAEDATALAEPTLVKKSKSTPEAKKATESPTIDTEPETIQIVVGSYDHALHGLTARVEGEQVAFADTFLFNAHRSAIRCVAVSPPSAPAPGQTQKVLLASGSTDERVNIYNLSAHPPSRKNKNQDLLAKVAPRPILENSKNKELGTLFHHTSNITALQFPTRSKLLTSSEDSTIAVTRTRDWSVLSTIKAPIPKPQGRPSGDTAPFGGTPSGVNDFAIHPSMKVMISVSKGERCMRLWNLVTGKKAGVLGFERAMLQEIGESRHSTGEGRRVTWGSVDGDEEFAVGFDRDIVVFGMDSVPRCRLMHGIRTKVHQFAYIPVGDDAEGGLSLLAVATEDGRILFFSTRAGDLAAVPRSETNGKTTTSTAAAAAASSLPVAKLIGFVGGNADGVTGRIKDMAVIASVASKDVLYLVGASSDGRVRLWLVRKKLLRERAQAKDTAKGENKKEQHQHQQQLGKLLGVYETQNRITCVASYLMIPRPEGAEDSEDEGDEEDDAGGDASDSDSGSDSGSEDGDA
ncbi:WD40/YVTN repeat-like-containing domain protein [Moelleriella libera RCEF 2490]|uniref:WD40/YVTN repeat-like-containing domain protein n=1 Tax=Moelleriella libera RCEF 2490 TaxID=1081109 RepID=A0A167VBG0_9HYPO|nr:WD40/YVTN repeat-like-containing domain protein [Moelleriella libera RCEF 2490]